MREPEKFGADNEIRPQTIRYGVDLLRPAVGGAGRFCLYDPEKNGEKPPIVPAGGHLNFYHHG